MKRILASISGGETSMYMAKWLKDNMRHEYKIIYVFANTSQEPENTLEFVDQCDKAFGLNVVWIEADINPIKGKGTKAIVTNFKDAKRNGEIFEGVIAKYGLPCVKTPVCTRELKSYAIRAYARSIGWKSKTYDLAIGIRADEFDRINEKRKEERLIYPFVEFTEKTKKDINEFWRDAPFRLKIKGYEGNCMTCFKKSDRKLATIALEHPERFDFFKSMENKYSNMAPEKQYFFRKNRSVDEIFELLDDPTFKPATDDKIVYNEKWDTSNGCSESCEVF